MVGGRVKSDIRVDRGRPLGERERLKHLSKHLFSFHPVV